MLRGCQKKIVFLKNTGSKIFDEAYFVISDNDNKSTTPDLIKEANRIIEENAFERENKEKYTFISKIFKSRLTAFLLGVAISVATLSVIILIIN